MKSTHLIKTATILILLVLGMSVAARPAVAQVEIPGGATIDSATFWIYVTGARNETVRAHRITAPWDETTVTWNSFGGSFDPGVADSFVANSTGWKSLDVTALVQAWVDGTYANYGLLLEQGSTPSTTYHSSEYSTVELRPKLEICYTVPGSSTCVTIQRPGSTPDDVADAYIWAQNPNYNGGTSGTLYTGYVGSSEKQSLC